MRFESGRPPDALHGILADVQFPSQFPYRPVRGSILRFTSRGIQNPSLQFGGNDGRLLSRVPCLGETIDTFFQEALLPAGDGRRGGLQTILNVAIRSAIG